MVSAKQIKKDFVVPVDTDIVADRLKLSRQSIKIAIKANKLDTHDIFKILIVCLTISIKRYGGNFK